MLNIIVYDHMEERLDEKTRVNWNENSKISDTFSFNDFRIVLKLASEKIFLTLIGMRNAKERIKMLRQSGLVLDRVMNYPDT